MQEIAPHSLSANKVCWISVDAQRREVRCKMFVFKLVYILVCMSRFRS